MSDASGGYDDRSSSRTGSVARRRRCRPRSRPAIEPLERRALLAIPAFPGAEGAGAMAAGGRGGDVYHVTNLNSSGAGSLSYGVSTAPAAGRTIVFDVSGYIGGALTINTSKITIAGQTAPGDGIGINRTTTINGDDVVIRFMRFRYGQAGDQMNLGSGSQNTIVDHSSVMFGKDENWSIDGPINQTLQWTAVAWGLQTHSAGGLVYTNSSTIHHTLWAHNHTRNPKHRGDGLDFVNNVNFDWDIGFIMGDSETPADWQSNVVGNYFISGTPKSTALEKAQIDRNGNPNYSLHLRNNLFDGDADGVLDGTDRGYSIASGSEVQVATPFPSPNGAPVVQDDPLTAYKKIVSALGPTRLDADPNVPLRDEVDTILINDLVTQRRRIISNPSQTGASNGGLGTLKSAPPPTDTDRDGMPDYWEAALGLNPATDDHNGVLPSSGGVVTTNSFFPANTAAGYTNLEEYLHFLAVPHATIGRSTATDPTSIDIDLRKYTSGFTKTPALTLSNVTNGAATLLPDGHTVRFAPTANYFGRARFDFRVVDGDGSAWTQNFALLVSATGAPRNLVWKGDGTANVWDNSTLNFLREGNPPPTAFGPGDSVTFDDTGSNTPAPNLTGTLLPGGVTVNATRNYTLGGTGALGGTTALRKDGTGTLTITTANAYSGGTAIDAGTVVLGSINANSSGLGTGPVTLDGATLSLFSAGIATFAGTFANDVRVESDVAVNFAPRVDVSGDWSGDGALTAFIPYVRTELKGDWSQFAGTLRVTTDADGGDFRIQNALGFGKARLVLPDRMTAYYVPAVPAAGLTLDIGELSGSGLAVLQGGTTATNPVTWRLGGLNSDSTFAGAINERTPGSTRTALTKIGTGTLALTGTSNYTGATTVGAGALLVNGVLGASATTVAAGATLGGTGRIGSPTGGAVTAQAGATLRPGTAAGPGRLTVGNGLTLAGATIPLRLSISPTGANDQIQLSGGTLALGGTNTVQLLFTDGVLGPGTYELITGGTATTGGLANLNVVLPASTRQTYTLSTQPGRVLLTVAGTAASLSWRGTSGGAWDVNTTANWAGATPGTFFNLDAVTFDDTATNGAVGVTGTVQPRSIVVTNATTAYSFGGTGSIAGQGSLTKGGTGTLTLTGSNSFGGGTSINGGAVTLGSIAANQSALGTGPVTFNGGTLNLFSAGLGTHAGTLPNDLIVATTGTLNAAPRGGIGGRLSGGGTLTVRAPYVRNDIIGDWSAFTGRINVTTDADGGDFRFGTNYTYPGFPQAAVNLADRVAASFIGIVNSGAGTTIDIGELSGTSLAVLKGGPTGGRVLTYRIGGRNTSATFAGAIQEQGADTITSYVKTGTGAWTLTGTASYRGDTVVEQGTLRISGALTGGGARFEVKSGAVLDLAGGTIAADSIHIEAGATLTGWGTIVGDLINDGTFAAGADGRTLTIEGEVENNGTLSVAAGAILEFHGPVVNNGLIDARNGAVRFLSDFVNNGTLLNNAGPTVAVAASASPNPVGGTITTLNVLGADGGGEPNLTYTWSVASKPAGAADPSFSVNATNPARSTTATFSAAGTYGFLVTITDPGNLSATSAVAVTVNQTLAGITVTPAGALLARDGTRQYVATARDQFGAALAAQPTFSWAVTGGSGTISSGGLFTASATAGPYTVTASSGFHSGSAVGTVDPSAPTADVVDVTPDPRGSPVGTITLAFSEPVAGFDLADVRLTRNGGFNLLTGAQTLTTGDNITWTLGNLAGPTATGGTYILTLTAAGSGITDMAGNPLVANTGDSWVSTAAIVADDGDINTRLVGPWTTARDYPTSFGPSYHYAPAGDGSATALWQLDAAAPGSYDVQVTWTAAANRASNAPYRIYDGNTLIKTVRVDQRRTPLGPAVAGVAFQSLGIATLSTGPLRVILGNDADNFVIADAARAIAAVPPEAIDDGQAGYSQAGAWTTASDLPTRYGPSYRYASAGNGSASASWILEYLAPGTYDVQVSWTAAANRASNAPYRIYDGGTLIRTVRVDQQRAPSGPTVGGAAFQSLGIVRVVEGPLRVVLGNDADSYVIADAARATAAAPPPALDDGQGGYTQVGPWTTAGDIPTSYGPTYRYAPAGNGTATATWQFDVSGPGSYEVQVTWTAAGNRASNAPFRVYDGNTLRKTVRIDQRRAPSGASVGGVAFQNLGVVAVTTGPLRVVLANDADDYVIADAARATAVAPPAALDDGEPGYSQAGPWTTAADFFESFGPTYRYAPTGDGSATASWQLDVAAPGRHDVQVTWTAAGNRATDAPYRIYDGNTLVQTVRVDQRRAPSGQIVLGVPFQSLGVVAVSTGPLRVVLGNDADGFVIADAVRTSAIPLPPAVDDGQPGYSQSAGWTTAGDFPTSYGPTYRYAPAGDGSATASWQLDVPAAGSFDVQVTWTAAGNRASNAPYRVYEGTTLLRTVRIDQRQAPSGSLVDGVAFQSLGVVASSGGPLRVVLGNDADGFVIADAARIAAAGTPQALGVRSEPELPPAPSTARASAPNRHDAAIADFPGRLLDDASVSALAGDILRRSRRRSRRSP